MRVAVLSEIHADLQALEGVLDLVDHALAPRCSWVADGLTLHLTGRPLLSRSNKCEALSDTSLL